MEIRKLVRPNILKLKAYSSARSKTLAGVLLDANENPFEDEYALNRYPDPNQTKLRNKAAVRLGKKSEQIMFGVGSDEILDLLFRVFCEPGKDNVIINQPTYGMYSVLADTHNINVKGVSLNESFLPDAEAISEVSDEDTKLIFICSPNNPTGNVVPVNIVEQIVASTDKIVVVDEAYIDFCEEKSCINLVDKYPNLVVLRTFSKAYGLAGIRLGYTIANPEIISLLLKVKLPYNINKLTEQVALAALENNSDRRIKINSIISERDRIIKELLKLREVAKVYHSDANFILAEFKKAKLLYQTLYTEGIVLRYRGNLAQIPNTVRISIGTQDENNKMLKAMAAFYNSVEQIPSGTPELPTIAPDRKASITRKTKETEISVSVNLDETGNSNISTGIGFFDHMLEQISRHGNIGLEIKAKGDTHIDEHHTVEDVGIVLGTALNDALGDKRSIRRYGFLLPMDESEAQVSIDLGGRPFLKFNAEYTREKVGDFPTELVEEFFRAVANNMNANIHISCKGENNHHIIEAIFKAFAKALNDAVRKDERSNKTLPSTKGVL